MSEIVPSNRQIPPAVHQEPPPRGGDEPETSIESVDLKESLAVLRRHTWLILGIMSVSLGIAGWVAYTDRPLYRAAAMIRLEDTRRALTGGLDDQAVSSGPGFWADPVLSQLQVLQSRTVATEVVRNQALGLRVVPEGFPARILDSVQLTRPDPVDTVQLAFGADSVVAIAGKERTAVAYNQRVEIGGVAFIARSAPKRQEGFLITRGAGSAIDLLVGRLDAKQRKMTDVMDVAYVDHDPYIAQQVVNSVVTSFQALNAETAQQQSRRRRIFLEEQVRQSDSLLTQAQQRLSDFRSHSQVYGSDERVSAEQSNVMDLETRRGELAANRRVYESLLAQLNAQTSAGRNSPLRALVASPGIAENPVVQALFAQLIQYQASLDTLTTGRWARAQSNPDVKRLRDLVASTESNLTDAIQSQISSIDARLAALDDLRTRLAQALQRLPATQATEARLVEQVQTTKNLAEQLREEYQKARIAEAVESGQVEIVDLAALPATPIGRGPKVTILLGLLTGILFGSAAAFLTERLNTAIRRREEIENLLQLPGLAIIPQIASANGRLPRLRAAMLGHALGAGHRNGHRNGSAKHENGAGLVAINNIRSTSAEAFRTLRTNLIFSQAVQTLRTIVVTSPSPQDGKTTTSANLAVTFAQQGMRVIIVDCDLRRGRLHNVFATGREPGLTQLLIGQAEAKDVVRPTSVKDLFFIPSGTLPPNPSELLGGQTTRQVLTQLGKEFDIILLDTPPVHVAADAMILGSLSDGVILVLRAGHTERHSAHDALQRLYNVGARVVGAVLNDPDHKVPQYGGYYSYDSYYAESEA